MAGRNVPESYNGLGYSNLIYITLQISIFCQLFEERIPRSLSHILFIEEPEAHLHPQMQMVFIRKIKEFIRQKEWNVQVVITTHSSQILSDCEFKCIRYFEIKENYCVDVKTLRFLSLTRMHKQMRTLKDFLA
jgi:predicted ATP-dependent endonuclease of OLD family